jgi:hypothetical protein
MARDKNALSAQIRLVERKVRKVDAPVLGLLLDMSIETESIHTTGLFGKKTFMIDAIVFICNPTVYGEKGREKGERTVGQRIRRS